MPIHSPVPNDDETPDTGSHEDAVADERLRLASLVIDQYELPFDDTESPAQITAGRARFDISVKLLAALIDKGSLRHDRRGKDNPGTFEVLSCRLRLTTIRDGVALRATIPLDAAKVAVPAGGLRFEADLNRLCTLCRHSADVAWQADIDLDERVLRLKELAVKTSRKPVRFASYRLETTRPGPGPELLDAFDDHACPSPLNGEAISRAITLCAAVLKKNEGPAPFVEIAHGVARSVGPLSMMIVTAPALKGMQITIPTAACIPVAEVLRHTRGSETRAFATANGTVIRDGIVELAIPKRPERLPATDTITETTMVSSTRLQGDDLVKLALFCEYPLDLHRIRTKQRTTSRRPVGCADQTLVELRRSGPDVLGLKFQRSDGQGWSHLGPVPFLPAAFVDIIPASSQNHDAGSDAASPPRDTPEIWGLVDARWLRTVCATFLGFATTTIGSGRHLMRLAADDETLSVRCFLPYVHVADQRFETPNSKYEDGDFEKILRFLAAAFGGEASAKAL